MFDEQETDNQRNERLEKAIETLHLVAQAILVGSFVVLASQIFSPACT